jgi:hypothetical protein
MDAFATLNASFALAAACAVTYAFWRPRGVFRFTAITLAVGLIAPITLALLVSLFANPAAGLGLALITGALTAFICMIAICAALGAAARYGWNALN